MRILIVGLPKSGTTILTYRIAGALDDVTVEFEPLDGPDPDLADRSTHLVTKKLVGGQTASLEAFAHYDRRIWICRDPRDFLVSQSLYRWHRETPPTPGDRTRFEQNLALLRAKEADPLSVPFVDLEPDDYRGSFDHVAALWRTEGDRSWLLYRYEDMVAGRYDELNRYLGFEVDPAATVADGLERVVRRKGSGDWRHWFTAEDVAHYRDGALRSYMDTFGYDHDDWRLDPTPSLDPEHGSKYVTTLFDDHETPSPIPEPSPDPEPVIALDGPPPSPARRVLARLLGRSGG